MLTPTMNIIDIYTGQRIRQASPTSMSIGMQL